MEISPFKDTLRIALVGDYSPDIVAHQAIPLAIDDAAAVLELVADYDWLTTSDISSSEDLIGYDAIWVVSWQSISAPGRRTDRDTLRA